jgi:hypothetical protein
MLISPDDMPLSEVVKIRYEEHVRKGHIQAVGNNPSRREMMLAVAQLHLTDKGETELDHPITVGALEWHWLLEVARFHGWSAKGTSYPAAYYEGRWKGSYVIPAGQSVDKNDVESLRTALLKALPKTVLALRNMADGPIDEDPHDLLQRFTDFTDGPYSLLIW